jgi:hypothetical protein
VLNHKRGERREFFRIDDSLSLSYRQIPAHSLPAAIERLENEVDSDFAVLSGLTAVTQEMTGTLHKIEPSHPEIAAYLKALDKKIGILGRALLTQSTELLSQPTQSVNLSASGISFQASRFVEPGSILELKILLMPSYAGILCFAEVVGCDGVEADPAGRAHRLRTNFLNIRGRDRDVLIQHVIQKQGAQLRKARAALELGGGD